MVVVTVASGVAVNELISDIDPALLAVWLANGELDCNTLLEAATVALSVVSGVRVNELIGDIDIVILSV